MVSDLAETRSNRYVVDASLLRLFFRLSVCLSAEFTHHLTGRDADGAVAKKRENIHNRFPLQRV